MKVKVVNKSKYPLPEYKTPGSAGMDLVANLTEKKELCPGGRTLVPTGLFLEIPEGYEAQVRPRSGLALQHGITVLNSPGTIDADYRGEVGVILVNNTRYDFFTINPGDRIAQLVFKKIEKAELIEVEELSETSRGKGGFGHTGRK